MSFKSEDVVLQEASTVEGSWSLTHGCFTVISPTFDPESFFEQVRKTVEMSAEEAFQLAIQEVIVGELYEWIGKLSNAVDGGKTAQVPELALNMAKYGALIIGLANKHLFTSGSTVFEEVLALPGRPAGYDKLCQMAMDGFLADTREVIASCETFWYGVVNWASELGFEIVEPKRIPF